LHLLTAVDGTGPNSRYNDAWIKSSKGARCGVALHADPRASGLET